MNNPALFADEQPSPREGRPSTFENTHNAAELEAMRRISLSGKMDRATRWLFGTNKLTNTKYTWYNFVPIVLFNQFKFFFNLFFLIVALSQFVEELRVGFLISYIGPLVFVLLITMVKEIYDDTKRANRDAELNGRVYKKIDVKAGLAPMVPSSDLQVGDIIQVNEGERVPADIVLLKTTEKQEGAIFMRTDQLDGETDWKPRIPVSLT